MIAVNKSFSYYGINLQSKVCDPTSGSFLQIPDKKFENCDPD